MLITADQAKQVIEAIEEILELLDMEQSADEYMAASEVLQNHVRWLTCLSSQVETWKPEDSGPSQLDSS